MLLLLKDYFGIDLVFGTCTSYRAPFDRAVVVYVDKIIGLRLAHGTLLTLCLVDRVSCQLLCCRLLLNQVLLVDVILSGRLLLRWRIVQVIVHLAATVRDSMHGLDPFHRWLRHPIGWQLLIWDSSVRAENTLNLMDCLLLFKMSLTQPL